MNDTPVPLSEWTVHLYHRSKENGNTSHSIKVYDNRLTFQRTVGACIIVSGRCKTSTTSCTQRVAVAPAMPTDNRPDGSHCLSFICCTTAGQSHHRKSEFARPAGRFQNRPNFDMHVTCHQDHGLDRQFHVFQGSILQSNISQGVIKVYLPRSTNARSGSSVIRRLKEGTKL